MYDFDVLILLIILNSTIYIMQIQIVNIKKRQFNYFYLDKNFSDAVQSEEEGRKGAVWIKGEYSLQWGEKTVYGLSNKLQDFILQGQGRKWRKISTALLLPKLIRRHYQGAQTFQAILLCWIPARDGKGSTYLSGPKNSKNLNNRGGGKSGPWGNQPSVRKKEGVLQVEFPHDKGLEQRKGANQATCGQEEKETDQWGLLPRVNLQKEHQRFLGHCRLDNRYQRIRCALPLQSVHWHRA